MSSFSGGVMGQGPGDRESKGQQAATDRGFLDSRQQPLLHPKKGKPDRPGYDPNAEPKRTEWEEYEAAADGFNRQQAEAWSNGTLLISEQQMGDAGFMASNQDLIAAAQRQGRLAVLRAPEPPE